MIATENLARKAFSVAKLGRIASGWKALGYRYTLMDHFNAR
jgi:hypothetical protein